MSHYYDEHGTPVFTVPKKDNSGFRPTSISDAKKRNLFPSVSTILDVLRKIGLEIWLDNLLWSCMKALPDDRKDLIKSDFTAFKAVVKAAVVEEKNKAPGAGSQAHNAIESFLLWKQSGGTIEVEIDEDMKPYVRTVANWLDRFFKGKSFDILQIEESLVHPYEGYAGTLDLHVEQGGQSYVFDWKTQNWKFNKRGKEWKCTFYPTWPLQLSAYGKALDVKEGESRNREHVSVCIDRNDPTRIRHVEWGTCAKEWSLFLKVRDIWMSSLHADYDPRHKE